MATPRIDFGLSREERLPAILLIIFFAALCVVGGASREDVFAQSIIRAVAIVLMILQVLFGGLPDLSRYRACSWLLGGMIAIAAIQLLPLPPAIWNALPGRAIIVSSPLGATGWRPINLVPDAGWNALWSLLVPLCALMLLSSLHAHTVRRAQYLLVCATIFSAIFALLQAAGSAPEDPLINGTTTNYAGVFANRNHQALFLAIGIVLILFWGLRNPFSLRDRRLWIAAVVVLLLLVSILVTGSRTGVLLGAISIVSSSILGINSRVKTHRSAGFFLLWPMMSIVFVGGVLILSTYFGRAFSLDRAANLTFNEEFRLRSLSTVLDITKTYFPLGAGLGTFDTVFRVAEPVSLLEPTYFNHAHNDFLETVIETGLLGPAILLSSVIWMFRRVKAAASQGWESARMVRLGALMVGLVIIASISDYPARTPMIMVVLTMAGCWLSEVQRGGSRAQMADALPPPGKAL